MPVDISTVPLTGITVLSTVPNASKIDSISPEPKIEIDNKLSIELLEQIKEIKKETLKQSLKKINDNYIKIMKLLQTNTSEEALEEKRIEKEKRIELRKAEMEQNLIDQKEFKKKKKEKLLNKSDITHQRRL